MGNLGRRVAAVALALTLAQVQVPSWAATAAVPYAPALWLLERYDGVGVGWNLFDDPSHPTSVTVYRGIVPGTLSVLATVEAKTGQMRGQQYVDTSAEPGTRYYYAVSATNAEGEGPRSPTRQSRRSPGGIVVATDKFSPARGTVDAPLALARLTSDGTLTALGSPSSDTDEDFPTVSPDGSTVVYSAASTATGDYDLWLYTFGQQPRRLTQDPDTLDIEPAFSPDGRTIAFTRISESGATVYVTGIEGGDRPLAQVSPAAYSAPVWSPNGRMLAVVESGTQSGRPTSWLTLVNPEGNYRRTVSGTVDPTGTFGVAEASWSPDGASLSYLSVDLPETETGELRTGLHTVPAAGGTPTTLATSFAPGEETLVLGQHWAPAGDRIVFTGFRMGSDAMLWSVPPAGGTPAALPGSSTDFLVSPRAAEPAAAYVPGPAPAAVSEISATLDQHRAPITWKPSPGAAWYKVYAADDRTRLPTGPDDPGLLYEVTTKPAFDLGGGLETGRRYRFTIYAMSPRGDVSPAALHVAQPAGRPVVRPEGHALDALSGSGPGFVATFGKTLPQGQSYEAQLGTRTRDAATGKWSAPAFRGLYTGTSPTRVVAATPGTTYYLRARVRDVSGNVTGWSATTSVVVPYDDRAFTAKGTWSGLTRQGGRFLGTLRQSKARGASLAIKRYGSAFTLVADRCPTCGQMDVYLDGKLVDTLFLFAGTTRPRQLVWTRSFSTIGEHTLRFVIADTGKYSTARIDGILVRR